VGGVCLCGGVPAIVVGKGCSGRVFRERRDKPSRCAKRSSHAGAAYCRISLTDSRTA
jgi:hypothetical protein